MDKKETKEKKPDKTEEAKLLIAKKEAEDIGKCTEELKGLLSKYGCDMAVTMLISPMGNQPNIQIIKKK